MTKALFLLIAPATLSLALAACSDGDGKTDATTTTGSTSSSSGAGGDGSGGAGGGGGGSGGAGGAGGSSSNGESVTLRAQPCEKSPASATKCESYEVECGGAPPAVVDVVYFDADPGVPKKGAVVFGSGGDGTGFYNFTQRKALTAAGFMVIDRRWPAGWFTGATEGPQQAACRYAALIRYLRSTVAQNGQLLCATGNSGGSAELGYALTWQKAGASLDFAMPTSGPFHRLDYACQGDSDATWAAECAALKASSCPDCASTGCQLGNGPASLIDTSFGGKTVCTAPGAGDLAILKAASPDLGPSAATLDGTRAHFLIGKLDPGAYEPLATSLVNEIVAKGGKAQMTYVDGAAHEMDMSVEGATAILNTLLAECVPPK